MKKPRYNSEKPPNNYGGDYCCNNYDTYSDGQEFCHDDGQVGWREFIKWSRLDDGKLRCNGNRHNCMKLRQQWLASLSENERKKYL